MKHTVVSIAFLAAGFGMIVFNSSDARADNSCPGLDNALQALQMAQARNNLADIQRAQNLVNVVQGQCNLQQTLQNTARSLPCEINAINNMDSSQLADNALNNTAAKECGDN